jgi:ABC-2 type transport system permease protein
LRRFAIAPRHVRSLLWLRWKLTTRGYTRSWRQVVGLIFMLIYLVPFSIGLGVGTGFAYNLVARAVAVQLLFIILSILYLLWAILPLLQYSLNEGLDITKLQAYPLTRGEQMVSLILATLLDVTSLVLIALYIGAFAGWHVSLLAGAISVVALAFAYFHTVTFSQLVLAALMGMLRSRRYRDVTIVVFALIGVSCSIFNQVFWRSIHFTSIGDFFQSLPQQHLDTYLQWLPPGMAARVIVLANAGQYTALIPWLVALIALLPVMMVLWARVLDYGITTAETAGGGHVRRRARSAARDAAEAPVGTTVGAATIGATARPRRALIPGPARAIAQKELRYYWRDPQLKAMLLGSLAFLVIIFLPGIYSGSAGGGPPSGVLSATQVLYAPIPALYLALNLSMNALGLDRAALQTLYLFPVRPLDVLWGKNLAAGAISYAAQVALVLGLAALTGGWGYVPLALVGGLALLLVLLGCGNVSSVLLPFRMRQLRVGSGNTGTEAGWLRAFLGMLIFGVTLVLAAPVVVAVGAPLLVDRQSWLAATLPAALAYGILLHQLGSRLIAPYLLSRAPEILRVAAPDT